GANGARELPLGASFEYSIQELETILAEIVSTIHYPQSSIETSTERTLALFRRIMPFTFSLLGKMGAAAVVANLPSSARERAEPQIWTAAVQQTLEVLHPHNHLLRETCRFEVC